MAEQALSNEDYLKNYTPLTKDIEITPLVITGKNDYAIGKNHYQKFEFPNRSVVKIQGKHGIFVEQTDELILAIKNFMYRK